MTLPKGASRHHRTTYYAAVGGELLAKDPHCFYCRRRLFECTATLDHFIPLSKGGSNSHDNLRLACSDCNREKASKMPTENRKSVRVWRFPVDRLVEYEPRDEAWARPLGFGREETRNVTFVGAEGKTP